MGNALQNKTVLVVGRGTGIARAITLLARSEGAQVVVGGRDKAKLAARYADAGISADVVDITDGAVDFLTRSLALELAPIRVNTISPGVIDTGAWDALADKQQYFEHICATNPARRIGTPDDIADAVLFAMTNTFLTGVTLKVDGGEPLT